MGAKEGEKVNLDRGEQNTCGNEEKTVINGENGGHFSFSPLLALSPHLDNSRVCLSLSLFIRFMPLFVPRSRAC